jgi:Mor family transcriptional regulator
MTILTRQERERLVVDLYNQGKTYREIAKEARISPRDIGVILNKAVEEKDKEGIKQQELSARAYELFNEKKTTVEVAIALNLTEPRVSKMYREYWKLRGRDILNLIYKETNGIIWTFLKLYKELIKKRRMSIEQVVNAVEITIHKLPHMESLYRQAKDEAEKMQRTVQLLVNHIMALEHKISILDKIAFSSEQECKRTEQQLQ